MKTGRKKMVNRSAADRRKSTDISWSGIERRRSSEQRKEWMRTSMWKSSHKPLKHIDLSHHQLIP